LRVREKDIIADGFSNNTQIKCSAKSAIDYINK